MSLKIYFFLSNSSGYINNALSSKKNRLFRKRVALDNGGGVGGKSDIADKGGKGVGGNVDIG